MCCASLLSRVGERFWTAVGRRSWILAEVNLPGRSCVANVCSRDRPIRGKRAPVTKLMSNRCHGNPSATSNPNSRPPRALRTRLHRNRGRSRRSGPGRSSAPNKAVAWSAIRVSQPPTNDASGFGWLHSKPGRSWLRAQFAEKARELGFMCCANSPPGLTGRGLNAANSLRGSLVGVWAL